MMKLVRAFLRSEDGNLAAIFAIASIPVIGMVGAGVDYARGNDAKTKMQIAVDSTALSLAKMPLGTPVNELTATGNQYFRANLGTSEIVDLALTVTPGQGTILVEGTGRIATRLSPLLAVTSIDLAARAQVKWGMAKLEVVLALDNTGSMSSNGKMTALKQASHNLLTTLQAAAVNRPDAVKVAIVPFDTTVNIGTSFRNEPWMNYTVNNIQPANWEGCVVDRDQSNDVQDTPPVLATPATHFPAADCGSLAETMPLTNNWTALHQRIDQMTPNGWTNVTIGLVWAWHALSIPLPLTQGGTGTPQEPLEKIVILLTDGDNTRNRWSNSTSQINSRTRAACTNIKAAGIKVYTVRVIDGNQTLLRDCATSPSMYYNVQQADQLVSVFNAIAGQLANLHLSR